MSQSKLPGYSLIYLGDQLDLLLDRDADDGPAPIGDRLREEGIRRGARAYPGLGLGLHHSPSARR